MTKEKFTTIKLTFGTKAELDKVKNNQESYNSLLIRLIEENKKLNKILSNVENLQIHLQEKEIIKKE